MAERRLWFVAIFAVSFVVDVISFATPYWYNVHTERADINGGLWQICVNGAVCIATPANIGDAFHGVQALMTLGLIWAVLGVIIAVSLCAGVSDTKLRFLGISSFLAGVLTVAGAGVFNGQFDLDSSWSLYLAYVAGVVYVLSGLVFFVRPADSYQALP